jgi:selenide,water dikinase
MACPPTSRLVPRRQEPSPRLRRGDKGKAVLDPGATDSAFRWSVTLVRVSATRLTEFSHGAGCACKLGPDDLAAIVGPLRNHPATSSPNLVVGLQTSDDGGVWELPSGETLVQTVDFFTPIVDDAYDWGRIAAANALSDVYAMGGTPITALQLVGWPRTGLSFELLGEVMRGGADVMATSGTTIVGGHSIDDPEPKYGFAVTGLVPRDGVMTNAGARPGDRLILTKPLGMGIITTALKRGVCPPGLAAAAVASMTTLNADAVGPMQKVGANAATDITGFGLLGHLREMAIASSVQAIIDVESVPVLEGVRQLVAAGVYAGGSERNLTSVTSFITSDEVDETTVRILADAQTSGGVLISVPSDRSDEMVDALASAGTLAADVIGEIVGGRPHITLR